MGFFTAMYDIIVEVPIAVIKDIATIGGIATGEEQTYTRSVVEKIDEDIKD